MMSKNHRFFSYIAALLVLLSASCNPAGDASRQADPLPSWNEGTNKQAIIEFVTAVTAEGTPSYVEPQDRVATFDNDGTLWAEKPLIQLLFVFERVKQMAENDPSMKTRQPYKAVIENDKAYLAALTMAEFSELFTVAQTGISQSEYQKEAADFFATAKAPSGKALSQLRYQPQLELLDYLRDNGFTIYLCSGGSVEFMRAISQEYYGVPSEQVIGTEFKYRFDDDANDIQRLSAFRTFNDKQEKPVNIQYHLGKRPILACGNVGGAGDIYMLRFSQGAPGRTLQLIVDHDDADREFYYQEEDNQSLDWAKKYGWQVISMKNDWNNIFADQ